MFEKIDKDSDIEKTNAKIKTCIRKMYNLAFALRPKPKKFYDDEEDESEEGEGEEEQEPSALVTPDCLPEYAMLDFLIDTKYTYPIQHFTQTYGKVPVIIGVKGKLNLSLTKIISV